MQIRRRLTRVTVLPCTHVAATLPFWSILCGERTTKEVKSHHGRECLRSMGLIGGGVTLDHQPQVNFARFLLGKIRCEPPSILCSSETNSCLPTLQA